MQNYRDNNYITDENSVFELAILSVLGDRESQEDCFGYELKANGGIVTLCDGMGGHRGGRLASNAAVHAFLTAYSKEYVATGISDFLLDVAHSADNVISNMKDEKGNLLNAGTTLVAVILDEYGLYWSSAGDSRMYLYRDGEFVQVTQDHNYRFVLDTKLAAADISQQEYEQEIHKGDALVSFLGRGKLEIIDYNKEPFIIQKNDKIFLMTDGMYKILSDLEIGNVINNFNNIGEALRALESKASRIAKSRGIVRDNMTAALIKIK